MGCIWVLCLFEFGVLCGFYLGSMWARFNFFLVSMWLLCGFYFGNDLESAWVLFGFDVVSYLVPMYVLRCFLCAFGLVFMWRVFGFYLESILGPMLLLVGVEFGLYVVLFVL